MLAALRRKGIKMKRTKKRSTLRTLALLLVCAFLLQCLPLVIAEDSSALPPAPSEEIALPDMVASLMAADGETYLQRAYDQEQSLNEVVLQINSRTYVSYMFNDPVKYTDATGTHDKDTTLIAATGGYRQKANDIQSFLPTHVTSGVTYSADGYSLKFTPSAAQNVVVAPIAVTNNGYGENYALYQRVFGENTALKYTPYYNSLKEEIVLNAYTGQTAFSFLYETNGLSFSDTENGLFLVNSEGETVFTFPELIAYDSNGKQVECDYTIETAKAGVIYLFTVSVPQAFLTAEDTVYPVYVDPTVTFSSRTNDVFVDTTVYSGLTDPVNGELDRLSIGQVAGNGTGIALFAFPGLFSSNYYRNIFTNESYTTELKLGVHMIGTSLPLAENEKIVTRAKGITTSWSESTATYTSVGSNIGQEYSSLEVYDESGTDITESMFGNWFLFDITEAAQTMCAEERAIEEGTMEEEDRTAFGIALVADPTEYYFVCPSSERQAGNNPFLRLKYSVAPLPTEQVDTILSGATYAIVNTSENLAITSSDESTYSVLDTFSYTSIVPIRQQYRITYKGNGKYTIRSLNYNCLLGLSEYNNTDYVCEIETDEIPYWYIVPTAQGASSYYLINAEDKFGFANGSNGLVADARIVHSGVESFESWLLVPLTSVEGSSSLQVYSGTADNYPHLDRYALFTQDDPTEGSTWDGTNLLTLKPSSSSAAFKTRIMTDGCVIASFAMMLNNYDVWVPYDCDDPRTTNVVESYNVPVDPFTATLANCIDTGETMPEAWPTFVNNVMSPSDSSPCSLKDNGSRLETVFGVNLVFLNSTSSSLNTAQKVAAKLNELLIEHPEGVVAYFKREINGVKQAHALIFLKSDYDPELHETESSIVEQLYCYDPIQLAGTNDGDGTELLKYKNSYTYSYEDTDDPAKTTKYQFSELLWLAYVEQ